MWRGYENNCSIHICVGLAEHFVKCRFGRCCCLCPRLLRRRRHRSPPRFITLLSAAVLCCFAFPVFWFLIVCNVRQSFPSSSVCSHSNTSAQYIPCELHGSHHIYYYFDISFSLFCSILFDSHSHTHTTRYVHIFKCKFAQPVLCRLAANCTYVANTISAQSNFMH